MLTPSRLASPRNVLASMSRALARPVDPGPAPQWLREIQQDRWRQLLPMLERFHCALLADPVGSGKTWIALAVAQSWSQDPPVTILVPAAIAGQWKRTAHSLGLAPEIWTHELLSRGRLPPGLLTSPERRRSLVIVDESHHFRNPRTRRYRTLAPALVGRTLLLVSATPVVNRLTDLAAQLHLGARDDALCPFGIPSLLKHLERPGNAASALGELVLVGPGDVPGKPRRTERRVSPPVGDRETDALLEAIDRLALSRSAAIAGLVRSVLWRALASSPLALLAALTRYRSLLLQARDAWSAGKVMDRSALRRFTGDDLAQLVMWELLPADSQSGDLVLEDLDTMARVIATARSVSSHADRKAEFLAEVLADQRASLVFVGARETVRFLRAHLQIPRIAWCTGEEAGIDTARLTREAVLDWFRPDIRINGGPRVLLTTDVAAEGLDLQAAGRIVHYDLPWTPTRMDQRDGRAVRIGTSHASVEVVRFEPYPPLEARLAQVGLLARKRRLPRKAGLDSHGSRVWQWRSRIAARFAPAEVAGALEPSNDPPWCSVRGPFAGALAGFDILTTNGKGKVQPLASVIGCVEADGTWSEDPGQVEEWMVFAETARCAAESGGTNRTAVLSALAREVRTRLQAGRLNRWVPPSSERGITCLTERLNRLASSAAKARDRKKLEEIGAALSFASRGHTAGEMLWLDSALQASDHRLLQQLHRLGQERDATGPIYPRVTGLILFHK